jgi:hypothetical protein
MMNRFVRRVLELGSQMSRLLASAAGCFVFARGFRLVAMGEERSVPVTSNSVDGAPLRPLAGIDAALFLLAFVTSEALLMIRVLCR